MSTQNELQKEFELERMILFSDAVFAIAITLLVLDIKFPDIEKGATSQQVMKVFKPVGIRFLAFMLTFFITGITWARHLKLFKYLRSYDSGVIIRNLVFLFFIVCFPFSASGITEHIRPGFFLPVTIYVLNLSGVAISQYLLSSYMFNPKRKLAVAGSEDVKKYLVMQSGLGAIAITVGLVTEVTLSLLYPGNLDLPVLSIYVIPVVLFIGRRVIRKYKPAKTPHNATH